MLSYTFSYCWHQVQAQVGTPHPDCLSSPDAQVLLVCSLRTRKDTAWWYGHKLFREETLLSTFQLWSKDGLVSESHIKWIIMKSRFVLIGLWQLLWEWVLASPSFNNELTQRSRKAPDRTIWPEIKTYFKLCLLCISFKGSLLCDETLHLQGFNKLPKQVQL